MVNAANPGFPHQWMGLKDAAGLAFVVLTLVGGFVQGDAPVYSEGPDRIKEWFANNNDRYLVGGCLFLLGFFVYLAFLAAVLAVLIRAKGAAHPLPWLALLGGAHLMVAAQTSLAFDPTLALLEGDTPDDLARTLSAADYMASLLLYPLAGVFALAVSAVILRTGALWRPLGWLGPLIAVGGAVAAAAPLEHDAEGTLTTVGYVTLFAFLAWTAGVSASMIAGAGRLNRGPSGSPVLE